MLTRTRLNILRIAILLASMMSLSSCVEALTRAAVPPSPSGGTQPEITVAAAADLHFAFSEIAALFEAERGVRVNLVFGSTGLLVQQIENGAPYDLIAVANVAYIDRLVSQDLVIADSVALYAQGRIVLASNRAAGVQPQTLSDLLSPQIRHVAIANPEHAPYGVAAMQALQNSGIWEQIKPKLVYGENVRQALQYIQSGDAQAGIVARSVADVPEITWILIDGDLYEPLYQALAIPSGSAHPELAAQFAAFINGEQGRPIMRRYGFILPGEQPFISPTSIP